MKTEQCSMNTTTMTFSVGICYDMSISIGDKNARRENAKRRLKRNLSGAGISMLVIHLKYVEGGALGL